MEISGPSTPHPKKKKCISFLYMIWIFIYFLSVVNLEKSDLFFVIAPPSADSVRWYLSSLGCL